MEVNEAAAFQITPLHKALLVNRNSLNKNSNVIKKILLPLIAIGLLSRRTHAQNTDTSGIAYRMDYDVDLSIMGGYVQGSYAFGEIGISYNKYGWGHTPMTITYFASTEIGVREKTILGPKIGAWVGGGVGPIAEGINLIYYTSQGNSSFCLRPEIGLWLKKIKLVYGYNIKTNSDSNIDINRHLIELSYCLKLFRLHNNVNNEKTSK